MTQRKKDTNIRCKRCGVSLAESKKYISPCHCAEKTYTKHLFPKKLNKPKVDNKWGEELLDLLEKQGLTPRDGHDEASHQIFEEQKAFISKRITQTQQETLEWVLDEVIGVDLPIPQIQMPDKVRERLRVVNLVKSGQRQTIKKKMGGEE